MQIQEDIANMIAQIADTMQELEEQERSALSQLDQVAAETSISMDDEQSLPPIEEAREPRHLASQKLCTSVTMALTMQRLNRNPTSNGTHGAKKERLTWK